MHIDGREFYSSLIRLHILHHAAQEPILALEFIEELSRHGYKLSAGTLYPMRHALERKGYLMSAEARDGRQTRQFYSATKLSQRQLKNIKQKVKELFGELFEDSAS